MQDLRRRIGREEFDYQALMAALSEYANPRDRVTTLLRRGEIIRVKKGLYVFGEAHRRRPYSREVLANLIYGPSMVSLESALSLHGLIPERVGAMTSVTPKRAKRFDTPIGEFVYRQAPLASFHLGLDRRVNEDIVFLVATPERALADTIRDQRGHELRTLVDMERYLLDDLRIDRSDLLQLDAASLAELADGLRSRKVALAAKLVRQRRTEP